MTPNDIEILIHCYVSPTPHPRSDASAVKETLKYFEMNGLIEQREGEGFWRTTSRGNALMVILCKIPLPEQKWVDQLGRVIGDEQP